MPENKAPRANFPRVPNVADRVTMLELDLRSQSGTISEFLHKLAETNKRLDEVDDWRVAEAVNTATRIEQQRALGLLIGNLNDKVERLSGNIVRALWIMITPILAGIPIAAAVVYLLIQRTP